MSADLHAVIQGHRIRFSERLEMELRATHKAGLDLAVSDFEYVEEGGRKELRVNFLPLAPGASPPVGRPWTVYKTGAR